VPTSPAVVAHLLRRVAFGGTRAEIDELARLDLAAIAHRLIDPAAARRLPEPPLLRDDKAGWWERYVAMSSAWMERMRTATPAEAVVEKMTLFWHGHFCSSIDKVNSFPAMWEQNQLFRTAGLGSFHDLARAAAIDPAMLRYLDNDRNVKGSPNENFARESMELFTLGVGNYSQDDVVAAARAWTGHTYDSAGKYQFRADRHDMNGKTLFGITQNWNGPDVLTEIVRGSKRDISARFVVTKLWSFLAYPKPEPALVDALAAAYLAANDSIAALLKAMVVRPEFTSPKATGALVRSPIEWTVAAMRGTGLPCDVAHPEWWLEGMGQQPFRPPNVSGWRANEYWISPSTMWARQAFAGHVRWKLPESLLADSARQNPEQAVRNALALFGIDNPSVTTLGAVTAWLERERRTTRWAERPNLVLFALLSPDVQLA
jgi:uncharacterized protein (DUF1800 family)